jgi:hypothetical protein
MNVDAIYRVTLLTAGYFLSNRKNADIATDNIRDAIKCVSQSETILRASMTGSK